MLPGGSEIAFDSGWVSGAFMRTVDCSDNTMIRVYLGASGAAAPTAASVNWLQGASTVSLGAMALPTANNFTASFYGPGLSPYNTVVPGNVYLSGNAAIGASYQRWIIEGR